MYIYLHIAPGPSSRPTIPAPSSERERNAEDLGNFISTLQKVEAEDLGPDPFDRECRICFEPYRECAVSTAATPDDAIGLHKPISGEDPVRLPCNHIFGQQCLEHWLRGHDQCPKCRRVLLPSIIDHDEVMPDLLFFDGPDQGQPGSMLEEESDTDEDDEPAIGLPEASNILMLLTNIMVEGKYMLENVGSLLDLIDDAINLVEMYQLVPRTVDDLRARNEKFNRVIAATAEWVRNG